jgi:non-homologous end joining protein Ku
MKDFDIELLNANKEAHPDVYEDVYEKAIEERVARKYSPKQEIAILRQKDRKPEEYAAYDAYVEQCKAEVKALFGKA